MHLASARLRRLPHERGLAAAVPTLQKLNTERAWLRHHREETFRCMHIVASLDDADGGSERVLCALRFDTDTGLLSATPGFSVPIDVDKEGAEMITRKGGPKLSTYRLTVAGALYEYTLDNVNDLVPLAAPQDQQLLRELELQDEKRDEARVAALRAREGTGAFAQTQQLFFDEMRLQGVVKRRLMLVEIVSAHELQTSEPVLVELRLRLPRRRHYEQFYWRLRAPASKRASAAQSQLTDGRGIRTRLSRVQRFASGATVAVFNLHTQIDLELCTHTKAPTSSRDTEPQHDCDNDSELPGATTSPVLSLSVFSQDAWGRKRTEGCCELAIPVSAGHVDRIVPIMKPVLNVREQLEELFLGADENNERVDQLRTDATTLHHVNSRLGVHVESTDAFIRVRVNTVDQTAVSAHASSKSTSAKNAHVPALVRPHALPELRVVKRSVNEILQSVRLEKRLAHTPLSSAEALRGATGFSAASAVESVLARLHAAKAPGEAPPLTGSI